MPSIDPHIFRAYDIRGKALTQLTEEAAEQIGKAFGSVLRKRYTVEHPRVVVGRDARTHGHMLEDRVARGLMSTGCHVLRMGETPSPVNYFTICDQKLDGGVQLTASHNPKEDNGLKLQLRDAEPYSGDDLQSLRRMIEQRDFVTGTGTTEEIDALTHYRVHLVKLFPGIGKGITVAVDGGNGIAGPTAVAVLKELGCRVEELFIEPDGNFPNHPADPSKHTTLRDLKEAVTKGKLQLGLAFDGDGDRVGIVDETGAVRTADEILLLLARDHLERHPGAHVVFTVSNSSLLEAEIAKWGGKPVMTKVGHSFVEHAMREHGAKLGGEQSGHFFCGEDYYGYDDALVAALRVLAIFAKLRKNGVAFSSLFSEFPKVYQIPELRPHCPDDRKGAVVLAATEHFASQYPVNTLDGARVDFGEGAWAGIRQSNTSPVLSICIEARSPEKLHSVSSVVLEHLRKYPEVVFDEE
jgi:phosphomannomutase / phosphoglucomutase